VGTGTSAATAIVAGAAALVRSRYPKLSAKEVIHRLTATATDKGDPGRDDEYGYGVLNLVAALTADVPPLTTTATASPSATPASPTPPAAPPATVEATAPPAQQRASGSGPTIGLGVVALVIAGGAAALIALILIRRRRTPGTGS
jgi:subtilisin family serine protease